MLNVNASMLESGQNWYKTSDISQLKLKISESYEK